MSVRTLWTFLFVALLTGSAHAQITPPEAQARSANRRSRQHRLDVTGRMLGYAEMRQTRDTPWTPDLVLQSARIRIEYRYERWFAARISAELTEPGVRDAYIEIDPHDAIKVRIGRFRTPWLAPWEDRGRFSLTTVGRGQLSSFYRNALGFAGRNIGATVRLDAGRLFNLTAGVFATRSPLSWDQGTGLALIARAQLEPSRGITFGLNGTMFPRKDDGEGARTFGATGLDADISHRIGDIELHAIADVSTGTSWYDTTPETSGSPFFLGTRCSLSATLGARDARSLYGALSVYGSILDPNLGNASDITWEGTATVSTGLRDMLRFDLQISVLTQERYTPNPTNAALDEVRFLLQAGGQFEVRVTN